MMGIIDSSQLAFLSLSHSVQQSGQSLSQRVSHTYTVVGRQVGICSTAAPAHRGWTTKSYSRVELVGEFSIMHVRQWCSRQKLERATQHPSIVLYRAVGAGRDRGACTPPQFLAAQLTLPHPGGRLCPPHYYVPPNFQTLLRPRSTLARRTQWQSESWSEEGQSKTKGHYYYIHTQISVQNTIYAFGISRFWILT